MTQVTVTVMISESINTQHSGIQREQMKHLIQNCRITNISSKLCIWTINTPEGKAPDPSWVWYLTRIIIKLNTFIAVGKQTDWLRWNENYVIWPENVCCIPTCFTQSYPILGGVWEAAKFESLKTQWILTQPHTLKEETDWTIKCTNGVLLDSHSPSHSLLFKGVSLSRIFPPQFWVIIRLIHPLDSSWKIYFLFFCVLVLGGASSSGIGILYLNEHREV